VSSNTWVIGAGGLLGSALARTLPNSFEAKTIRWSDQDQSSEDLKSNLKAFTTQLDPNQPWRIIWAAGHATVSSSKSECQNELTTFSKFVSQAHEHLSTPGHFFLTSSAGGVYAGSSNPPFDSESVPVPTSAYGLLKLDQEKALTGAFASRANVHTTIGRISNLYGPGQNLGKLQGLISHLILAALSKKTMNIFVPLDTIRDFVFVEDAAETINAITTMDSPPSIAVIASGEPKSLATVISQVQGVIRVKIPIAYGQHASSNSQVADLRMIPTIACPQLTPLPAGVKTMQLDLTSRLQESDALPE
jgi:UDP-glucose 4-epimerase